MQSSLHNPFFDRRSESRGVPDTGALFAERGANLMLRELAIAGGNAVAGTGTAFTVFAVFSCAFEAFPDPGGR